MHSCAELDSAKDVGVASLRGDESPRHCTAVPVCQDVDGCVELRGSATVSYPDPQCFAHASAFTELLLAELRRGFGLHSFRGPLHAVYFPHLSLRAHEIGQPHAMVVDDAMHERVSDCAHDAQCVEMTLQEWAVRRVVSGLSCLVVAPTGMGKSLLYQLPSWLLQNHPQLFDMSAARDRSGGSSSRHQTGIIVVVSPLLALIRDQLLRLPTGVLGVSLSGALCLRSVL